MFPPKIPQTQLDFLTNRPFELMYQGRKTRNLELSMCIFSMCQVVQDLFLKSWFSSLLRRVDINIKIGSRNDLLAKHDDF